VNSPDINLFFLTSSSLTIKKMIELFEQIVLTPEEDLVIEALQIIEPTLKRIAVFRDNFVVLLSNNTERIPLGNMGDGIQKILGLALALVNSKDGILLVDEIDTGLHFMTISKMWKLVWETAKKLNVQVFATTHNSDCWTGLTELIDPDNEREDGITLHRIEKDKPHSILLGESEIAIAVERGIEVR
jgi:AAA15 family ATPase/GTPase